jgi:hypothetical protein
MTVDPRIPVIFGQQPGPGDVVLAQASLPVPPGVHAAYFALSHAMGCACCVGQSPAGAALNTLFRDRATGKAPFFKRVAVLAGEAGIAAVKSALAQEALARARYVQVDANAPP